MKLSSEVKNFNFKYSYQERFQWEGKFEPRLEGGEGASDLNVWGKGDSGRETHKSKVPEPGVCPACSRKIKVASVSATEWKRGQRLGNGVKDVIGRGRQTTWAL